MKSPDEANCPTSMSRSEIPSRAASTTRSVTAMPGTASPPTVLRELEGPDTCDMCGTPGLKTELVRDPFIYGAGDDAVELVVEIPVRTCSSCGRTRMTRPKTSAMTRSAGTWAFSRQPRFGICGRSMICRERNWRGLPGWASRRSPAGRRARSSRTWPTTRHLRLLQDPAIFLRAKSLASREPVMTEWDGPTNRQMAMHGVLGGRTSLRF